MEERKFLIHEKVITLIAILFFCLLLVGIILLIVFNIIAGMSILTIVLIITLSILWRYPFVIIFNSSCIKIKTIFGKVKKLMYWSDLKKIILKELFTGGHNLDIYCMFISTEKEIDFRSYEEVNQEDQVILMSYRRGLQDILKQYTNLPIEDKSELKEKNRTKNEKGSQ